LTASWTFSDCAPRVRSTALALKLGRHHADDVAAMSGRQSDSGHLRAAMMNLSRVRSDSDDSDDAEPTRYESRVSVKDHELSPPTA